MVLIVDSSEQLLCIPSVLLVSAEVGCEVDRTVVEEVLVEEELVEGGEVSVEAVVGGGVVTRGSGEASERGV